MDEIKYSGRRFYIQDIPVDSLESSEALDIIFSRTRAKGKTVIFTPNIDHVVKAHFDRGLRDIYADADLSLADGMPLVWSAPVFGGRLPERINGTNLVGRICDLAVKEKSSIFLLGTQEGTLALAQSRMESRYPGIKIAGFYSLPYRSIFDPAEDRRAVEAINACKPDILLVAFGCPAQEKWINKYRDALECSALLAVGSALGFIAGEFKRAPVWMQRSGLEWLHRFFQEPRRLWKRYLFGGLIFPYFVLRQAVKRGLRF